MSRSFDFILAGASLIVGILLRQDMETFYEGRKRPASQSQI